MTETNVCLINMIINEETGFVHNMKTAREQYQIPITKRVIIKN